MPEACNIQHKIQQIMNMVKTNFYRIQVYKCFAVNDIGSKHENKTAKKKILKIWTMKTMQDFLQMLLYIQSKCLWILVENKR